MKPLSSRRRAVWRGPATRAGGRLAPLLVAGLACLTAGPLAGTPAVAKRAPTSSGSPVPQGFVGIDADGPLLTPGTSVNLPAQMSSMVAAGVQSVRVAFSWQAAQPYATWSQVPAADRSQFTDVGGVPTDFQPTDTLVRDAARAGLTVLPTILYAPPWDARPNGATGFAIPQRTGPYAAYAAALVHRYGPRGSFWAQNRGLRKLAITRWQIWNEPNLSIYWPQPFARGYLSLLRAAHAAIKRADRSAQVVLGALTDYAWRSLGQIYRIPGAARLFDIVAVNGFTKRPADVIRYLRFTRNALIHHHDARKPLLATEVSWPSAVGNVKPGDGYDFDTTRAGQSRDIRALLPMLGAERRRLRLIGFYYYTWMGDEGDPSSPFHFSGLLAYRNGAVQAKPALAAFRAGALKLEGCVRKGSLATRCIRRR